MKVKAKYRESVLDAFRYEGMTPEFKEWFESHGFEEFKTRYSDTNPTITSNKTGWIELDFWEGKGYLTINSQGLLRKWNDVDFNDTFEITEEP